MEIQERDPNTVSESPPSQPGFRFHPTDEELVGYYLTQKVHTSNFVSEFIGEVDFNNCEPWDLHEEAKVGHQSPFYFFSRRDRKYRTGVRTNRATQEGHWKATGKYREVMDNNASTVLGMKKTLVFRKGRASKGVNTNWMMYEYTLKGETKPGQQDWVVCVVFEKIVPDSLEPNPSFESEGMPQDSLEDASISGHG